MDKDKEKVTLSIDEASNWASKEFNKDVTNSNISYLIQYGHLKKIDENGATKVYKDDVNSYYSQRYKIEIEWKEELGDDLNWQLSFDEVKEKERTKHVHRLHPYKGKFIPQLVNYFLDSHTDNFKRDTFFNIESISQLE